jgi:hypothetical protein
MINVRNSSFMIHHSSFVVAEGEVWQAVESGNNGGNGAFLARGLKEEPCGSRKLSAEPAKQA